MSSISIIGAETPSKKNRDEFDSLVIDVFVGVFFDGTNNNMMQSMIGQHFRRKEVFKNHRYELGKAGCTSVENIMEKPRSYWENSGIFTRNELDQLYESAGRGDYQLEKDIASQNTDYSYSSVTVNNSDNPVNLGLAGQYQKKIDEIADPNSNSGNSLLPDFAIKGAFANGSTYTNPCLLWSHYITGEDADQQYENHKTYRHRIYVEGSGADSTITAAANFQGAVDDVIGLGFGVGPTGVAAKCRKMVIQINNIYGMYNKPGVKEIRFHFDVFGFSRGATTARLFTYLVNPKHENSISNNDFLLFTGKASTFLPLHEEDPSSLLSLKEVRVLGIYDTVSSIGILRDPLNTAVSEGIKIKDNVEFAKYGKSQYHDRNVDEFGLYATTNAKDVLHICALDENRINFSLVDIESSIKSKNGTEIFMPGCHTDIGGGASIGLDDLKIINKEATNTSEILGNLLQRVKDAKNVITGVNQTINSANRIASGVKSMIDGIKKLDSGSGFISAIQNILEGACTTYGGVRDTVSNAHSTVSIASGILTDVQRQAGGEQNSGKKTIPNYTDGSNDFVKKGTLQYAADITRSDTLQNISNQFDNLIEGGNQLVDGMSHVIETSQGIFQDIGNLLDSDSPASALDQADQTIGSFVTLLNNLNSSAQSMSTVANAIKSAIRGHESTEHHVAHLVAEITSTSNSIIQDCSAIRNDIALSKETLEILRTLKDEILKENDAISQNVMKLKIDDVNDALDSVSNALIDSNTAISGIQTMIQGMENMNGVHGTISGINSVSKGLCATYKGVKESIDSISQAATGIWNNLESIYQNTLNGFITPQTDSGQGTGANIQNNLTQTASGLQGIDQSYQSLEQNAKLAYEKIKGLGNVDFGTLEGIDNSLSAVSSAINYSEEALNSLKGMIGSTQQASSNILGLGENLYTAATNININDDILNPLKDNLSEFIKPATGKGDNVLGDIVSNLEGMASGLTDTVSGYGQTQADALATINAFKGIKENNIHSFKGILGAFSDTSEVITKSIATMKDFKSTLESAKQTCTNTLGLAVNLPKAISEGYQGLKNGLNTVLHPSEALSGFFTPNTGTSNSVITNLSSNVANVFSGIEGLQTSYHNTLGLASNVLQKVKGLKNANLHSVSGIVQALTDSASAINSTINVFKSIPNVIDNIKQTSTNILGIAQNLQQAFTIENGHFVIVNECSDFIKERCEEMKETFKQAKETANELKDLITGKKKISLPKFEKREICFYNYYPCSEPQKNDILPVGLESLKSLGWVGADSVIETNQNYLDGRAKKEVLSKGETVVIEGTHLAGIKRFNNIGLYKYVYPGYSNIPLKMMMTWCSNKAGNIFNPLNEMRHAIPSDLKPFYNQIEQSPLKSKGRFFCVPKYQNLYRKVRLKYVHFSMNQQLKAFADNTLVNGPSLALMDDKMVIIRRIYIGEKGSPTAGANDTCSGQMKYLYDYLGDKGTLSVANNINIKDVQVSQES